MSDIRNSYATDVCRCALIEKSSTDLAILALECPLHNANTVELDPDRGMSVLATDDITAKSYEDLSNTRKVKDEVNRYLDMLKLIAPLAAVGFLSHIPTVATSLMCGRLNTTEQGAVSLAMSTSNYAGFSFILGLLTAYQSLGAQALGAGRKRCLGLLTARSLVMSCVMACYVAVIWFYAENVFNLATSTKKDIDKLAGVILRIFSISLPFYCIDAVLTKFMIIIGYTVEAVYLRLLSVIAHIALSYLCIFTLDMSVYGAGIALTVTEICTTIATISVLRYYDADQDIWININFEIFKGWRELIKLGSAGIVMLLSQSLSIETTMLMLSTDDIDQYAAFLVLIQYHQFFFHLYHGFTMAGAIITGKNLGAQDANKAKRDCGYFSGFSAVCGLLFALFSMLLRYQISYLLSDTTEVETVLKKYIPVYCLYVMIDCTQVSIAGVIQGMGKQVIGAAIYFSFLCAIGVPLAYILIQEVQISGFGAWTSMIIGSTGALAGLMIVIRRTDWLHETNMALEKLEGKNSTKKKRDSRDDGSLKIDDVMSAQLNSTERMSAGPPTDSESSPLFMKSESWNVLDLEAKLAILLSVFSFLFMVASIILYFVFEHS